MKISTWLISALALLVAFTGGAEAQCKRHFYNNSPLPFAVGLGASGLCNNSPSCTINPHDEATLIYYAIPGGAISIGGSALLPTTTFALLGCLIVHKGPTGPIAVNDPADGDVTTCGGDGWACPPPPPCRRTFYNHSDQPASVNVDRGSCNGAASCTIDPGQTGALTYNRSWSGGAGAAVTAVLPYGNARFDVGATDCKVATSNAPDFAINKPKNGDISTCGAADFPCPPPAPCHPRHFYNNTTVAFSISVSRGTCNGAKSCTIAPGQVGELIYVQRIPGNIAITSPIYNHAFDVSFCRVLHSGNTGPIIAVNDPADGDVNTCGHPDWPCPASLKSRKHFKRAVSH